MISLDILKISFRNLFRQKMRTFLTVVSMMIGAFLISIMLSVGTGLKEFMISQVTLFSNEKTIAVQKKVDMQGSFGMSFGQGVQEFEEETTVETSGTLSVDGSASSGQSSSSSNRMQELMEQSMLDAEDLEKIRSIEHVDSAAFETFITADYVRLNTDESKKLRVSLYGMPDGYLSMLSFKAVDDSLLTDPNAIVLSDGYAEAWGQTSEELVGETVWVKVERTLVPTAEQGQSVVVPVTESREFELRIAGFFEKNLFAQMGFVNPTIGNEISAYVQNVSIEDYLEKEKAFELIALVDDARNVQAVDRAIEKAGYDSSTTEEAIGQIGVVFDVISGVLSSFGFVAMFVSSIGIANTLLMAIYERTREIGVMKAVGATQFTVSLLFTAEAIWLGIWGGVLGVLMGYGVGRLANTILHNGIEIGGVEIVGAFLKDYPTFDVSVFTLSTITVVMAVTVCVAFVAGLYPSLRAGRLNPIVALRHD